MFLAYILLYSLKFNKCKIYNTETSNYTFKNNTHLIGSIESDLV